MMSKKDYERAAEIMRERFSRSCPSLRSAVEDAFVELFRGDNPRFDSIRFRIACQPKKEKKA